MDSSEPPPASIQPGQIVLKQYRVKQRLGAGGMGTVWLVEDIFLKTDRALKLIAADLARFPEARLRFQREAQVMARIKHEHAVVVHTAQVVGDVTAIVMEYIEGESIDRVLRVGQPMGLSWVSKVLQQLCAVLQVAHDHGIVHRDLKPSNLMLVAGQPAGEVFLKVLDFGLAKVIGAEGTEAITRAQGAFGTVSYMSPEQALGKEVDSRSDIYTVGVILYEFLTGHRPYQGQLYQVINSPPPPFRTKNPSCRVPPEVERVVMQCLKKAPELRPPSAKALADAFLGAARPAVEPGPASTSRFRDPPVGASRSWGRVLTATMSRKSVAIATLAVLGIALGVGFSIGTRRQGTVLLQFDGPVEGLDIRVDGTSIEVGQPVTLAIGRHEIVATEGDFTAAREPIDVVSGQNPPIRIKLLRRDQVASRLAGQARSFLKNYCHRCHGVEFQSQGLDVLDQGTLLTARASDGTRQLVPGQPAQSALWLQLEASKMPPRAAPQPTEAEREQFRSWIVEGAPADTLPRRPFRSEERLMELMLQDLEGSPVLGRPFQRYFTLTHLYNNPAVHDDELDLYRAALSKAINSLSNEPEVVVPRAIDQERTIYRIDLRDFGWVWDEFWVDLLRDHPYGLAYRRGTGTDRRGQSLARRFYDLSGAEQPFVRADWFVARATRPPLYHRLLASPETAVQLERMLAVDVQNDFRQDRLSRAGLVTSRVSPQNRLLERHEARAGRTYYWKSFEFRGSTPESDVLRFPLGPAFEGHPFPAQAFKHSNSAIVYGLANGLQGYLLIDAEGNRIGDAPEDLLSDPQATAGSRQIVTGLSCMACHRLGVIGVSDDVRAGNELPEEPRHKVETLFPPHLQINVLVMRDQARFQQALKKAIGPMLSSDNQPVPDPAELPEPIGYAARRFHADLRLADAACELGLEDVALFRELILGRPELRRLGLESLVSGGTMTRQVWESTAGGTSLFQRIASEVRR